MTEFNYEQAARDHGWAWNGVMWTTGTEGYRGTAQALCFFIGVGPEWERWTKVPYKKPPER